jgi:hypothetical protein
MQLQLRRLMSNKSVRVYILACFAVPLASEPEPFQNSSRGRTRIKIMRCTGGIRIRSDPDFWPDL